METTSEFLANNWIYLMIGGIAVLLIVPWLFVIRHRRNRAQIAQAKVLKFWDSGLTIGTSSNEEGGNMRGINLLLEIYPQNGQTYEVQTREQIHVSDVSRLTMGMMVEVRIHPNKPKKVIVSQWSLS